MTPALPGEIRRGNNRVTPEVFSLAVEKFLRTQPELAAHAEKTGRFTQHGITFLRVEAEAA